MSIKSILFDKASFQKKLVAQSLMLVAYLVLYYLYDKVLFEPRRWEWPSEIIIPMIVLMQAFQFLGGMVICIFISRNIIPIVACTAAFIVTSHLTTNIFVNEMYGSRYTLLSSLTVFILCIIIGVIVPKLINVISEKNGA